VRPDANPEAVNIFFVDSLSSGELGRALVPGPSLNGTYQTGWWSKRPSRTSSWLSSSPTSSAILWNTADSLATGAMLPDPFDDTTDFQSDQLMLPGGEGGDTLSAQQARVIRLHPWVRH
jgi:hypothetical protein